jgi:glycosyltransferase involved in cell wall biosynthesis
MKTHTATVTIIDPPLIGPGQARPWRSFAFSDISRAYARRVAAHSDFRVTLAGSYDIAPALPGADAVLVPAARWQLRNPGTRYLLYRRYSAPVRAERPALIHSADYYSLAVIAAGVPDAVPVITTPGCILERKATVNPYDVWFTRALEWAVNALRRRNAWVLATSPYMALWWERSGFDPDRIRILPQPTDLPPFNGSRAEARAAIGWEEGRAHLLSVADLRAEMQLPDLLRLFAGIAGRDDAPQLHVLGAGALAGALVAMSTELGVQNRVVFHGRAPYDRLSAYCVAADALLVSRRYNSTPRAAQEALLCGTPVIANLNESLCGFGPGIERAVHQVDFGAGDAVSAIRSALEDSRRLAAEREKIAVSAQAVFGGDRVGARLVTLYREILGLTPTTDSEPRAPESVAATNGGAAERPRL